MALTKKYKIKVSDICSLKKKHSFRSGNNLSGACVNDGLLVCGKIPAPEVTAESMSG